MCIGKRVSVQLKQFRRCLALVTLAIVVSGLSSNAMAVPVFPGCEGYGCDTTGGRGGVVCIVTNVNNSGTGSFRDCLLMKEPRIVIFRVSGTIELTSQIVMGSDESYLYVAGQTAPGDGIALKGPGDALILRMGQKASGSGDIGAFTDAVFQHLRFRHGSANDVDDAFNIFDDSHHIIFDHNSITWTGDEAYNLWGDNIHDITFSHNIIAEGIVLCATGTKPNKLQNYGPLHGGGVPQYNITYHHNLFEHACLRNPRIVAGANGTSAGLELVNNVNYNNRRYNMFVRTSDTGNNDMVIDAVNNYYKRGPDGDPFPFTVYHSQDPMNADLSIHLTGNTWRNQDGSDHANNDEADNYNMISNTGRDTWPHTERATRISPQPEFPVTETSAEQAYIDVVINEDVGATLPRLDEVDQRLVDDPEDGSRWSASNVPTPRGSADRQTYNTFNVPIDTDDDGVPDSFEESPLGTDPNAFELQAILDHDGDGYTNIEEWIHSLSGPSSSNPPSSRPNPPTLISAN